MKSESAELTPRLGKTRILVASAERGLRESLLRALRLEGWDVTLAERGSEVLRRLQTDEPAQARDAVVVDVVLHDPDGVEVTRRAGLAGSSVPILLLAQGEDVANGVAALDAGGDQWLAAPFAVEELLARLRALLRRTSSGSGELLRFSDLELDARRREVRRAGAPMALTRTEFLLLRLFLLNPGRVLTRHAIHSRVWGYDFRGASDTLRVHIGGLRRKLEAGGRPRLIHTARGVGYALREPQSHRSIPGEIVAADEAGRRAPQVRTWCFGEIRAEQDGAMAALDGEWRVVRTGGALPPLIGIRKRITGSRGETALGPLPGVHFSVEGLTLRYRAPLSSFVDELEPDGEGFRGRATFRGREYGRFQLRRRDA